MYYFQSLLKEPFYIRAFLSVLIFVVFWLFKKWFSKLIIFLLRKLPFKHMPLDTQFSAALQKPLNTLFLFTGIYFAICISPFASYADRNSFFIWVVDTPFSFIKVDIITKFYQAVFISVTTWGIYNLEHVYEEVIGSLNTRFSITDNTLLIRFSATIIRFFTIVLGAAIVLSIFIKNITGIITGVGLGGVAFAFVAKDALSNILSGALLMLDKPFVIGDWIQVNTLEGTVEDISFRSTRIRTFTQGLVVIPNAQIGNEHLINWSRMEKRRVKFSLGVGYNTPLDKLKHLIDCIEHCIKTHDAIDKEAVLVAFDAFGDYALGIQIIYYTLETDYASHLKIKESINLAILELCEKQAIEIAFPTQTLHVLSHTTPTMANE